MHNWITGALIIIGFLFGCNEEDTVENQAPTCSILEPRKGTVINKGTPVQISVDANDSDGLVVEVIFLLDDTPADTSTAAPYNFEWTFVNEEPGYHVISAIAIDDNGSTGSDEIYITVNESVIDIEGNLYTAKIIGEQLWMTENLKTTRFNDGEDIPLITADRDWYPGIISTPAYSWYRNDEASYKDPYGALYNWYTIETGKLCPEGWHVPTAAEYTEMVLLLGGYDVAGGKMKEVGIEHWLEPNIGATNESGFTALPGGSRSDDYNNPTMGAYGNYWTATDTFTYTASGIYLRLFSGTTYISREALYKNIGFSVRCIKD